MGQATSPRAAAAPMQPMAVWATVLTARIPAQRHQVLHFPSMLPYLLVKRPSTGAAGPFYGAARIGVPPVGNGRCGRV